MTVRFEDLRSLVQSGGVFTAADLLEKLSDVLTVSQKLQLVSVLAVATKGAVRPGDLITAELANQILEDLVDLKLRVAKIEAGSGASMGAVTILDPSPSKILRIGAPLIIIGTNFGKIPKVMLEEALIMQFEAGSNDQKLIVKAIPNIQNIPQHGRQVSLTVTNETGAGASTTFTLAQPEVTVPTGSLTVMRTGTVTQKIVRNGIYIFPYSINATSTLDETYDLEAFVDAGWPAVVLDSPVATGQIITSIFITKGVVVVDGTTVNVNVRVTIPDDVSPGDIGNLTLKAVSQKNPTQLKRTSDQTVLTIDQLPPPPQAISIVPNSVTLPGTLEVLSSGRYVISVPATGFPVDDVITVLKVTVPETGNYSIQVPLVFVHPETGSQVTQWSATIVGAAANRAITAPNGTFSIIIRASATAEAARFRVRMVSDSDSQKFGEIDIDVTPI